MWVYFLPLLQALMNFLVTKDWRVPKFIPKSLYFIYTSHVVTGFARLNHSDTQVGHGNYALPLTSNKTARKWLCLNLTSLDFSSQGPDTNGFEAFRKKIAAYQLPKFVILETGVINLPIFMESNNTNLWHV